MRTLCLESLKSQARVLPLELCWVFKEAASSGFHSRCGQTFWSEKVKDSLLAKSFSFALVSLVRCLRSFFDVFQKMCMGLCPAHTYQPWWTVGVYPVCADLARMWHTHTHTHIFAVKEKDFLFGQERNYQLEGSYCSPNEQCRQIVSTGLPESMYRGWWNKFPLLSA